MNFAGRIFVFVTSSVAAAACATSIETPIPDPSVGGNDDAASDRGGNTTDGSPNRPYDSGNPYDAYTPPSFDSGNPSPFDSGNPPPFDSGGPPLFDSGGPPLFDAGLPTGDSGVACDPNNPKYFVEFTQMANPTPCSQGCTSSQCCFTGIVCLPL